VPGNTPGRATYNVGASSPCYNSNPIRSNYC
jgi:hypothetical protein